MIFAYFAPPGAMLRRIGRLGRRGQARIITAAKSDNNATIAAARHSYSRLLRRHVEMYEYQPAKLHTKLAIVDDIVHIGSSNFDYRSLYINMEIMLRIKDAAFADAMRGYVEREIGDSNWITPELHKQPREPVAADQVGGVPLPRERHGLHGHAAAELPRRSARPSGFALIGPEQGRRRDVDPFEAALDRRRNAA